ncbi:hypothetical protein BJ742DRAFT_766375 [Cladochytrium replicatum]|nr:hypothetical protein BJ742DRAFT_766375 [Cladochytrium replicatum]
MTIVRIGPTHTSAKEGEECEVNGDTPVFVHSHLFVGAVTVKIRNHDGPNGQQNSPYFTSNPSRRRLFSIQFSGQFGPKPKDLGGGLWSAEDVWFAATMENKVNPPMGTEIAVRFLRVIDPTFSAEHIFDVKGPWCGSYLIVGMNAVAVRKPSDPNSVSSTTLVDASSANVEDTSTLHAESNGNPFVRSWPFVATGDYDGAINEDLSVLASDKLPSDLTSEKKPNATVRRRYFSRRENREAFLFEPGLIYDFEFYNQFLDLNTLYARFGINIDCRRAAGLVGIGDRPPQNSKLRFEARSKDGKHVFFWIELGPWS